MKKQFALIILFVLLFSLCQNVHAQDSITINLSTYAQTIERSFCFTNIWKEKVKIICNDEWITVTADKEGRACFKISVSENDDDSERKGTVILKGRKESMVIVLIQEGQDITSKFECENFRKMLKRLNTIPSDSLIRVKDVEHIKKIIIGGVQYPIKSFAGLEYFRDLESLTYLERIIRDTTKHSNLDLDLSKNTKLKYLNIRHGTLKRINVTQCPDLEELYYEQSSIDTIDVSNNYKLRKIIASYYSSSHKDKKQTILLPSLGEVKPQLEEISLDYFILASLDLYRCPSLKNIQCSSSKINNLDLKDCNELTKLQVSYCDIEYLDLRDCHKIDTLNCKNGSVKKIRFGDNSQLSYINCQNNKLTELNTTELANLKYLNCSNNRLTHMDFTYNTNLEELYCNKQQHPGLLAEEGRCGLLQELILPENRMFNPIKGLRILECKDNKIKELDLSKTPNLTHLNCNYNHLQALNVSHNMNLIIVDCSYNYIHQLDFSSCIYLRELNCGNQGYQWLRRKGIDYELLKYLYLPNQQNAPVEKRLRWLNIDGTDIKNELDFSSYPDLNKVEFKIQPPY